MNVFLIKNTFSTYFDDLGSSEEQSKDSVKQQRCESLSQPSDTHYPSLPTETPRQDCMVVALVWLQ